MAQQQPQRRTIVVLNLDHVAKAFEAAKKIEEKTGQKVTIRDAEGAEIDTINPVKH